MENRAKARANMYSQGAGLLASTGRLSRHTVHGIWLCFAKLESELGQTKYDNVLNSLP